MPTLHWYGDTFENTPEGVRGKYIHTVGNTASFKYTVFPNNERYTGIFESGADHGILRISSATQPDFTKTTAAEAYNNFIPGMGIKFLRSKVHAGTMVAMHSVDGDKSWNMFRYDFTNHVQDPQLEGQKMLAKRFEDGTKANQQVGLSDIASYDQHGNKVENPKFPF